MGKGYLEKNIEAEVGDELRDNIDEYLNTMEEIGKRKLLEEQERNIKDFLNTYSYKRIIKPERVYRRNCFNATKIKIIDEYKKKTKQEWPIGATAHHIIELEIGGPNEWWNIYPLMEEEHLELNSTTIYSKIFREPLENYNVKNQKKGNKIYERIEIFLRDGEFEDAKNWLKRNKDYLIDDCGYHRTDKYERLMERALNLIDGYEDMVLYLINQDRDRNIVKNMGQDILGNALIKGKKIVVNAILDMKECPNISEYYGSRTIFDHACTSKDTRIVKRMIQEKMATFLDISTDDRRSEIMADEEVTQEIRMLLEEILANPVEEEMRDIDLRIRREQKNQIEEILEILKVACDKDYNRFKRYFKQQLQAQEEEDYFKNNFNKVLQLATEGVCLYLVESGLLDKSDYMKLLENACRKGYNKLVDELLDRMDSIKTDFSRSNNIFELACMSKNPDIVKSFLRKRPYEISINNENLKSVMLCVDRYYGKDLCNCLKYLVLNEGDKRIGEIEEQMESTYRYIENEIAKGILDVKRFKNTLCNKLKQSCEAPYPGFAKYLCERFNYEFNLIGTKADYDTTIRDVLEGGKKDDEEERKKREDLMLFLIDEGADLSEKRILIEKARGKYDAVVDRINAKDREKIERVTLRRNKINKFIDSVERGIEILDRMKKGRDL
ncbi:MAG: hypothetical protein J6Y29_03415 [Clostridiales bacterium]|nr:hypothetical protein [Clostridiales bacterium]